MREWTGWESGKDERVDRVRERTGWESGQGERVNRVREWTGWESGQGERVDKVGEWTGWESGSSYSVGGLPRAGLMAGCDESHRLWRAGGDYGHFMCVLYVILTSVS